MLVDQGFYSETGVYHKQIVVIQVFLLLFYYLMDDIAEEKYEIVKEQIKTGQIQFIILAIFFNLLDPFIIKHY